jgi:hypothetical protein
MRFSKLSAEKLSFAEFGCNAQFTYKLLLGGDALIRWESLGELI